MKKFSLLIVVILLCLICIAACVTKPKTIQFISDNTVVASLDTAGKEKLTLPANPQKEGFVFEGWFVDKDVWSVPFGENYLLNKKLKADMKVYAKWTEKNSVLFMVDGQVYEEIKTNGNEALVLPAAPEKSGHRFDGWFVDQNTWQTEFTATYLQNTALTSDLTVYAKWTVAKSVFFYVNGEIYSEIKTNGNEVLVLPDNPEKDDYRFDGWYVDENTWETEFTADYLENKELTANLNVYAKWTQAKTIFFIVDGQTYAEVKTNGNETIQLPAPPTKQDHNFDGWFVDENTWETEFTADYFEDSELTANLNVYAKFTQKKSVKFFVDGELYHTIKTDGNETVTMPASPVIDGREFLGWYVDEGVWEEEFTETYLSTAPLTQDLSVYAKFRVLYTNGLLFTYIPSSATYAVSGYIGTSQTVTLPGVYDGKAVTEIAESAFRNNSQVTSVIIPDGMIRINAYAFGGCANLQSIQLPDSVREIKDNAFFECTKLQLTEYQNALYLGKWLLRAKNQSITQVTIKNDTIGIYAKAFYNCASLTNIAVPEGVVYIGDYAFYGCADLTQLTLSDSIRIIGKEAFAECPSLSYEETGNCLYLNNWLIKAKNTSIESAKLKNTTVGIYRGAFANCVSLEEIVLPNTLKSIGEIAFSNCGISFISIPSSVEYLGERVFFECPNLASLELHEGIKNIPNYTFYNCPKFVVVNLPDSIESIGIEAFTNCGSLTVINISDNVFYIGDGAFAGCPSLQFDKYDNCLYLGNWAIVALNSKITETTLKTSTLGIYPGAFSNCTLLQRADIPQGVVFIGEYAFFKCALLQSISVPESVMYIGDFAFYGCAVDIAVAQNNPIYKSEEGVLFDKKRRNIDCLPHGENRLLYHSFFCKNNLRLCILQLQRIGGNKHPRLGNNHWLRRICKLLRLSHIDNFR